MNDNWFTIIVPRGLLREVTLAAQHEGVSLQEWTLAALSHHVGMLQALSIMTKRPGGAKRRRKKASR